MSRLTPEDLPGTPALMAAGAGFAAILWTGGFTADFRDDVRTDLLTAWLLRRSAPSSVRKNATTVWSWSPCDGSSSQVDAISSEAAAFCWMT